MPTDKFIAVAILGLAGFLAMTQKPKPGDLARVGDTVFVDSISAFFPFAAILPDYVKNGRAVCLVVAEDGEKLTVRIVGFVNLQSGSEEALGLPEVGAVTFVVPRWYVIKVKRGSEVFV